MTRIPERPPIDRTQPPYRDDPVIARLTDEHVWALAEWMAGVATRYARKYEAAGGTVEDLQAGLTLDDIEARGAQAAQSAPAAASPAPPSARRTRRPSPSRLAKWEAQWQAEQGAEGES